MWLTALSCAHHPVALRVVALNDFHGALYETPLRDDPTRAHGGLPLLVGAVEALRAEDPDLLVLDGGDLFQGSWPVNRSFGRASVDAFGLLGVDAAAVGNHEFDYGIADGDGGDTLAGIRKRAADAPFAWLSANIHTADGQPWAPPGIAPWVLVRRTGLRIGVIGLTTQDTPQTTTGSHVASLRFTDVVDAAAAALVEVQRRKADVVVIVGHLTGSCDAKGFVEAMPTCKPGGEIGRLLDGLPSAAVDLIVSGHAHTFLSTRVGETFVVENRDKGRVLGIVDLVVGRDGVDADASKLSHWELLHDRVEPGCEGGEWPTGALDVGGRSVVPSAEALALIRRYEAEAGSLCDPVGCASKALGRSREAESGVGDLVADAMRAAFPDTDVAVTNSGGLRDDLRAGTVRREHLQQIMPFDNRLVQVAMTGAQLRLLMRLGTSGGHGILQVSGLSLTMDPAASHGADLDADGAVADWERDRLCDLEVNGEPVRDSTVYDVVTTDFLANGGDHMALAFGGVERQEGPLLRDWLFQWVDDLPGCIGDVPLPDPDAPRIRLVAGCKASVPAGGPGT